MPEHTDAALRISGLHKRFPSFALSDVDLIVPRGYVMGFVGANGAGKTTTIKVALGMVVPDAGTIDGPPREDVGVVLDTPFYVRDWRVREVAKAVAPFYPRWSQDRFDALAADFGLPPASKVKELSRGMGMKLMMAVALSHDAKLLLLDEPTSGLDPLARDQLLDLLARFMEDESHAILFSTHITTDLERIADLVTIIDRGRILVSTDKDDLLERYVLVRGGPADLPAELRGRVRGLREHTVGFDGLVTAADATGFGPGVALDRPSLDDLVVRLAGSTTSPQEVHS